MNTVPVIIPEHAAFDLFLHHAKMAIHCFEIVDVPVKLWQDAVKDDATGYLDVTEKVIIAEFLNSLDVHYSELPDGVVVFTFNADDPDFAENLHSFIQNNVGD